VADGLVELIDIAPTLLEEARLGIPEWMQGISLASILKGEADSGTIKRNVRCEYYDAADQPDGTLATMYFDGRYKLIVYHGHGLGEMYDLQSDPGEFINLWNDASFTDIKMDLLLHSFDSSMCIMDRGSPRIGPM